MEEELEQWWEERDGWRYCKKCNTKVTLSQQPSDGIQSGPVIKCANCGESYRFVGYRVSTTDSRPTHF